MKEFLFARMTWMVETIDQMLAGTARKKVDEEEEEDISNEEEEEEEVELEGATEDGETGDNPISGELTPLECQINNNSAFHKMPGRYDVGRGRTGAWISWLSIKSLIRPLYSMRMVLRRRLVVEGGRSILPTMIDDNTIALCCDGGVSLGRTQNVRMRNKPFCNI